MNAEAGDFQTVDRLLMVMNLFDKPSPDGLRFTDIMERSGLGRSSTHRTLQGLVEEGFIDRDVSSDRYFLGFELLSMFVDRAGGIDLRSASLPFLENLSKATGDTVYLVGRIGDEGVCINRVEGTYPVRALTLSRGDHRPLGVGAASLALLAYLQACEQKRIVDELKAQRMSFGITDELLVALIERATKVGYAVDDSGFVPGMIAIGLPIFGSDNNPIAALSVSSLASRMPIERQAEIVVHMHKCILDLQENLGPLMTPAGVLQAWRNLRMTGRR